MGVQFNIKDAETVRLARELADQTGKSITETIRLALEEEARRREASLQQLLADVRRITAGGRDNLLPEWRDKSFEEIMNIYDDDGM